MPCPWSLVKRKRLAVHLHELAVEAEVILSVEEVAAEIAVVPVPLTRDGRAEGAPLDRAVGRDRQADAEAPEFPTLDQRHEGIPRRDDVERLRRRGLRRCDKRHERPRYGGRRGGRAKHEPRSLFSFAFRKLI
jgi:hypothetical protein